MAKWFDKMFYGREKKDFERRENVNPIQHFLDMLVLHAVDLVRLNLMFLVALIPVILWTFLIFPPLYMEGFELAAATPMALFDFVYAYLFGLTPCLLIAAPAFAGMAYVTRKWASDEHAWIWSDFKDAMKANWFQALVMILVTMVLLMMTVFYIMMGPEYGYASLRVVGLVIIAVILMLHQYIFPLMVSYKLKIIHILRNAMLFMLARLHLSLLTLVITLLPLGLGLWLNMYFGFWPLLVVGVYYMVIGFSFTFFMNASYANTTFARHMKTEVEEAAPAQEETQ